MMGLRRCAALLAILLPGAFPLQASVPSNTWQQGAALSSARSGATATLMADGRILIVGGKDSNGNALETAEVINPDGTITPVPSMLTLRYGHSAILLNDGNVLVAGGHTSGGGVVNTAELFDPAANTWRWASNTMTDARADFTLSQLLDGTVLVAGGENGSGPISGVETFDLLTKAFKYAGYLNNARKAHAASVLKDGRVLITGGSAVAQDGSIVVLNTTEIYDPTSGTFSAGPALNAARYAHSSTTLIDGTVLVAGGNNGSTDLASLEIFDPVANSITTSSALLSDPRSGHVALLLPNNNHVLIAGGTSAGTALSSTELYRSWTSSIVANSAMSAARDGAVASALQADGMALVAGGSHLASTELYGFATLKTDASDYPPGTNVHITGSGWEPGETVVLTLVESPLIDTHGPYGVVADANGNIADNSFTTDEHDLNIGFALTAVGSKSQASNTFTDANPQNLTIGAQTPTLLIPGGGVTYAIGLTFNGNSKAACTFSFSISPLPSGASGGFNPSSGSSTGSTVNSILTITTTAALAPSTYPFTVSITNIGTGCEGNVPSITSNLVVQGKAGTTTTITNPGVLATATVVGQAYPVTYTVAAGSGTPTGTVTVSDGFVSCSASVAAGTCNLASTSSGTKNITATYAGDASFATSTSSGTSHVVNAANTTTALTSSLNPSVSGQSVTFTAKVTVTSPGVGLVPLGSVITFKDGAATLGTGTTDNTGVATYSTTALTDGNHSITAVYPGNSDFTTSTSSQVTQLVKGTAVFSSLVPSSASITYGQATISISGQVANATKTVFPASGETVTVTINGTPLAMTIQGSSGNFSGTFDTHAISASGSPYTISYSYAGDTNLTASTDTNTKLNVTKAILTVTANDLSTVYGAAVPAYTSTITGFVNGEPLSVVTGSASLSTTPATPTNAGTYTINAAIGTLAAVNYSFSFVNGTLTINKAVASVTPNAASKTYGTADPALSGTLSGFLAADSVTAVYSRAAGETVAGGPYSISAVLSPAAVLGNYNITYNTAQFTITQASATVTPNAASKVYGTADAALTGTLTGFVASDNVTATYSRVGGETVTGGPYTITAKLGPAAVLSNYNITYNTAQFTITQASATVTPNATSKVYGTADPVLGGTLSGFLAADTVTATYSRTAGETVAGGPYSISAALSPAAVLGNYNITYNTAQFTITKATPAVTWNPSAVVYGAPLGSAQLNATTTIPGSWAYTPASGTVLSPGSHTLSVIFTPTDSSDYTSATQTATVQVLYSLNACLGDLGHSILQPINADGSSTFKQGSTVPAKFRVCDAMGHSIGTSGLVTSFNLVQTITGTVSTDVDEDVVSTTPDSNFRWDPSAQQWIFNVSTKPLSAHTTYVYLIGLNDGSAISFRFGLPK